MRVFMFEMDLTKNLEYVVYQFRGTMDKRPTLVSYWLKVNKKAPDLWWEVPNFERVQACDVQIIVRPMDWYTIYKGLDWT